MDPKQPGSPEAPDFVPQLAVEVPDNDGSSLGYVAIDSVFGLCPVRATPGRVTEAFS
jgi:hypothetical protein